MLWLIWLNAPSEYLAVFVLWHRELVNFEKSRSLLLVRLDKMRLKSVVGIVES